MAINIAKANQGEFYPFVQTLTADDNILSGILATFTSDINIEGTFVVDNDNVYIDSILTYSIKFQCDRCLADVNKDFKIKLTASYYLEGEEEIEGYYPYNNNLVDLKEPAFQEIILNLPTRILCKPDCKGICPVCGINLNESSCDCAKQSDNSNIIARNNPFSALKDLNKSTGGANNGSSKG